jgi:hypothetical protein
MLALAADPYTFGLLGAKGISRRYQPHLFTALMALPVLQAASWASP